MKTFAIAVLAVFFSATSVVFGAEPHPQPDLAVSGAQTYVLLIGSLVPLVTYVLNHYAPWVSESVKGVAHVVTAAVAGGLYQALEIGDLGFNAGTVQLIGSSVLAALAAHKLLYVPSGINVKFKGGSNVQNV